MHSALVHLLSPVLLWAIAFLFGLGLVTLPLAHRRLPSVSSPYARAEPRRRLLAALADSTICILAYIQTQRSGNLNFLLFGLLYAGLKDSINGQSVGKLLFGLTVVRLDGGIPIGPARSLVRNAVFLVPGFNLAALSWEMILSMRDPQGFRLGDRLANTQVIEGSKLSELIRELKDRFLAELAEMERRFGVRRHLLTTLRRGASQTVRIATCPSSNRMRATSNTGGLERTCG